MAAGVVVSYLTVIACVLAVRRFAPGPRIPGAEVRYLGPGAAMPGSIWEHNVAIAAANEGIWFGSSEDYEVELIGWTGETIRRVRWDGPDLKVAQEDIDRYRDALEADFRRSGDAD